MTNAQILKNFCLQQIFLLIHHSLWTDASAFIYNRRLSLLINALIFKIQELNVFFLLFFHNNRGAYNVVMLKEVSANAVKIGPNL